MPARATRPRPRIVGVKPLDARTLPPPPRIRLPAAFFFFRYRFAYGWLGSVGLELDSYISRHLPGFKRDRGRVIRKWRYATRQEKKKMKVRLYGSAPPGLLTGEPVIGSGYAFSSLERTFAGVTG